LGLVLAQYKDLKKLRQRYMMGERISRTT